MSSLGMLTEQIQEVIKDLYRVSYVNDHNASNCFLVEGAELDALSNMNEIKDFCRFVEIRKVSDNKVIKRYTKRGN